MDCQSALAEAEVEYADVKSDSIYVRFASTDDAKVLSVFNAEGKGEGPISCVIWTTTPWTLPANRAICLNEQLKYSLVQVKTEKGAERFIMASDLIDTVMAECGIE